VENPEYLEHSPTLKRKKTIVLLLFFICFMIWPPASYSSTVFNESVNDTLTVITYNIHHGRGIDGKINPQRIADVINQSGSDIAALQEVDINTSRSGNIDLLKILSDKTGLKHTSFGLNLEFEGGEYGNAILSRYPLENIKNHHFKNISGEQRGVLTAVIDIYGEDILLVNTHLDHTENNDSERVLYAEKIRDMIIPCSDEHAVIMAGDLNDGPDSDTYHIINRRLKDAWISAGSGDGFTIPVQNPERRIDYIFYSGNIKPVHAETIQTEASDHLPVVVKFMYGND